ncbi:MAG: hypothetical protein AAF327_11845 [Cyanobacteria bacterium P01_A01_bin.37]
MNEESQDWIKDIESATQEFGQFMQETVEVLIETADLMIQVPMAIAEQVEEAIATEVDQFLEDMMDWFHPPINLSIEFDRARFGMEWHSDFSEPWIEHVDPTESKHAACVGCQHYHGRVYNDTLLVCGMHPYGWDGNTCPDWESKKYSR